MFFLVQGGAVGGHNGWRIHTAVLRCMAGGVGVRRMGQTGRPSWSLTCSVGSQPVTLVTGATRYRL